MIKIEFEISEADLLNIGVNPKVIESVKERIKRGRFTSPNIKAKELLLTDMKANLVPVVNYPYDIGAL